MTAPPTRTPTTFEADGHTNTNGARRLLTAEDLAVRWQVKSSHVYRLTRGGVLPAVRLGRYYRYRLEAVAEFEANGGAADV